MEVIKVVDFTEVAIHMKELMFIRINNCSDRDIDEIFRISPIFNISVIDYIPATILIESVQTEKRNNDLIALLKRSYANRIEIVRGGNVAVGAL